MSTIITRLYATRVQAEAALAALRKSEFVEKDLSLIEGAGSLQAILGAGVYKAAAETYASHLDKGSVLVVVRAPFGSAVRGKRILDGLDPIDAGVKHTEVYVGTRDTMPMWTPRRPARQMRKTDVLALSDGLFPPAITKRKFFFSFLPLLSRRRPEGGVIKNNPTPFSSALGLPVLSSWSLTKRA